MVSCGIVGLPNVGKSTLFNALRSTSKSLSASAQGKLLSGEGAKTANYPFTTIEPNVGVVEVPDERLIKLADVIEKEAGRRPPIVPAVVRFVDIAGLVKGAYKGEGLGNQFLSHVREVDAIVFVLRHFQNSDIIQTGSDPTSDLEVLKSELLLKDLETLEKRIESMSRELKTTTPTDPKRKVFEVLEKAKQLVEQGKWLEEALGEEETQKIKDLALLSIKKSIIVLNCDEKDLKVEVPIEGALSICAKLEEELAGLSEEDQKQYLVEIGLAESGLEKLIKRGYEILNLISFLTAGEKEVRAWTLRRGSTALRASGTIHSDFERGFIAADVVDWREFVKVGGWHVARSKGLVKTLGKSDVIPEDVVVEFKFSI